MEDDDDDDCNDLEVDDFWGKGCVQIDRQSWMIEEILDEYMPGEPIGQRG